MSPLQAPTRKKAPTSAGNLDLACIMIGARLAWLVKESPAPGDGTGLKVCGPGEGTHFGKTRERQ
jgi:hypothetical protein